MSDRHFFFLQIFFFFYSSNLKIISTNTFPAGIFLEGMNKQILSRIHIVSNNNNHKLHLSKG